jgi:hypothetical protein
LAEFAIIFGVGAFVVKDGRMRIIIWATALMLVVFNASLSHAAIYEWVPAPTHGGTGAITLTPGGVSPTDTDFTTSTVTDFEFFFDNGAAGISLSDIVMPIGAPSAIGGALYIFLFREAASFTDARLVFAAGSADYKNFIEPIFVPALFPVEVHSGTWVLSSLLPLPTDPPVVPIPAALPLFATGLGVLGFMGWRRRKAV